MMRLKYVNPNDANKRMEIYWGGRPSIVAFSPIGDCPDELADTLLKHPSYKGMFVEADKEIEAIIEKYPCDKCYFVGNTAHSLRMHTKFKHKETKEAENEESTH